MQSLEKKKNVSGRNRVWPDLRNIPKYVWKGEEKPAKNPVGNAIVEGE